MSNEALHEALADGIKDREQSILCRLFRKMLIEMRITPVIFVKLTQEWVSTRQSHRLSNTKAKAWNCGNLKKELLRKSMNMKVFVKMLQVIRGVEMQMILDIKRLDADGGPVVTEHSINIDLSKPVVGDQFCTGNVLKQFFLSIRDDLGIKEHDYPRLTKAWLINEELDVPKEPKRRSSCKGNLTKELKSEKISFDVFMKLLTFLEVKDVTMSIILHRVKPNKSTSHSLVINNLPQLMSKMFRGSDSP